MGRISVLSVKREIDLKGEYFHLILNLDGRLSRCFLRSDLDRNELLRRLTQASEIKDLYTIDDKAILYTA